MRKRETELLYHSKVIHTTYHGEIDCDEILSAIDDWKDLIENNPSIEILIFDYMDATMTPLSTEDVKTIAEQTAILTDAKQELVMIGVMHHNLDAGLTNMWRAYSNLNSAIPDKQMLITRNLEDAITTTEQILNLRD